ncbi:PEP-utilizing protein [Alicyclobacillus sp. TC]|uniref:Pyruvate,water dikinase n=1 Tax=Alicyclobacillus tolerans TaxID=90970 RepID=A0ABT9LYU7_9BACL|nr:MULTISPECIES: PEP-utilizing enzyme [Alicyclobacillus]MDP9729444.1 pyruvate,water dikinase [Alicyclobacillus tengchongensis]QRF22810.1 PEP-utilizing protein [Alicyclobacillus sp. TC]
MNYIYSEKDQHDFFVQDDVHFSHVLTPLFASFQLPNQEEGTRIAFDLMKMPIERFVCRLYRGRFYQFNSPYAGDLDIRAKEHERVLMQRMPVIMEYYQDKVDTILLPFYRKLQDKVHGYLKADEALSLLKEMHQFYTTAWAIHFDVILPRLDVGFILEDLYQRLTDRPGKEVYDLLVGVMSKTLETDRAFWELANELRQFPALVEIIANVNLDDIDGMLQKDPDGQYFVHQMKSLLDVYGYRTSYSHEFIYETWRENPKYAWELIRSYLQRNYHFNAEFDALVRRRQEALNKLLEQIPDSPLRQEFLQMYQIALQCWGLDEDHHFYIDTMLPAVYRPVLLNIARTLVSLGVIDQPTDIHFLYYEEICEALQNPQNLMNKVQREKEAYQLYQNEQPVPHLGPEPSATEVEDLLADRLFGLPKFLKENTSTCIKGYAASQGVHTGTVRIVKNQDEFGKLNHGDILVCKTTTPPWTVLFSVAGAIVTDAGGILSHAGTVAREYRIPAVLGTKIATSTLRDGDVVTVNGTEGTITLES